MSWFGEGLSNLKGQISSFTKEVLAEASAENAEQNVGTELAAAQEKIAELQLACSSKDAEVSRLVQRNQELEARLKVPQTSPALPAISTQHPQLLAVPSPADSSIVEEEQDGWSQFSEEDFPCLQEHGEFSSQNKPDSKQRDASDDEKSSLRNKLRDAEARVRELEAQNEAPVGECQRACLNLMHHISQLDEKGTWSEEQKHVMENVLCQLRRELHGERTPDVDVTALQADNKQMQENMAQLKKEAEKLKAQVSASKEENSILTRNLEELDEQNQMAVERLLALKDTLQQERDSLSEQLKNSQVDAESQLHSALSDLEAELRSALIQSLPESVAHEVSGAESATGLGRAVARQCADLVWKKEASERKLAEVMREARELRQELGTARSEVAKLREHSERLMGQLSVAGPSSSGALEPIPEGREEEGDVASEEVLEPPEPSTPHVNVEALQREAEALREARENLESEVNSLRTENQALTGRVRSLGAELRNQENLQHEVTALRDKAAGLQTQVQDAAIHRETLEQQLVSLRQEIQQLNSRLSVTAAIEHELQQCKEELTKATAEKDNANTEINRLLEEISCNKSKVQEIIDLNQEIIILKEKINCSANLLEELESCKSQLLQYTKEREMNLKENTELMQQIQEKEDELSSLQMKLKNAVAEKIELEELIEQQKQQESENTNTPEVYSEQIQLITDEKNCLQLECQKLKESLHNTVEQINRDKREHEKDIEDKLRLAGECERLQLEVENALEEKINTEQILNERELQLKELTIQVETNAKNYAEKIAAESKLCAELQEKFSVMEKSYRDVIDMAEDLKTETVKWKAQAEQMINKTGDDDMLIKSLESEIAEWKNKAVNIEESYQTTSQGYQEIVKAMEAKESFAKKCEIELEKLKVDLEQVNDSLENKTLDCISLEETIMQLQEQHNEINLTQSKHIADLQEKCRHLEEHNGSLNTDLNNLEKQKSDLETKLSNLKLTIAAEQKNIEKEAENFIALSKDLNTLDQVRLELGAENEKLKEEVAIMSQRLEVIALEKSAMKDKLDSQIGNQEIEAKLDILTKEKNSLEQQNSELKKLITEADNLKQQFSLLQTEKNNILGVLDEKTRENSSLRSENHRLMALVANEKATSQQLLQEKTEILSRKEFQSSEASEMARESVASLAKIIRDKDQELESLKSKNQSLLTLMQDSNPGLAIHQLFGKHPDVEALKSEVHTLQQEKAQLVHSLQQKHQESVQYHAEIQRLSAALSQVGRLPQDSTAPTASNLDVDQLMHSLSQEQQRNKFLQNEVQELSEKEGALQGELGRLRQHLITVEEQYTEELLRSEQLANELRSQLATAEERARNTVTSLSSASARAGQQVELLQEQARVASAQRDEALRRLSAAEEEVRHHTAGLRNLQSVLEQFQQDKERDIELASERLRQQLKMADQRSDQLVADMKALQSQLQEAKEGLSAAARLGVQMDKKSEQIVSLKEEVLRLGEQLQQAQGQINSASQSMEGKVDKYLVKNLIVGYFMAAPNNRLEALRIVATVLDFSREERSRVGLEAGTPGRGSAQKAGAPTQSLAEAFIQFLEKESRPVPQVRMLEEAVGRQRKASPAPGRSPLLMSEMVLPSFAPVPTLPSGNSPSSSSSTLKDVLRDS